MVLCDGRYAKADTHSLEQTVVLSGYTQPRQGPMTWKVAIPAVVVARGPTVWAKSRPSTTRRKKYVSQGLLQTLDDEPAAM